MLNIRTARIAVLASLVFSTSFGIQSVASAAFGHVAPHVNSSSYQDDSVWINAGINSAIASGDSEYDIPAGTYQLMNPIVVPGGLHNFTLRGAGSTQTIITTPNNPNLAAAIVTGTDCELHNDWGLTNVPNVSIVAPTQGATTITLNAAYPVVVGGTYAIYDKWQVHPSTDPTVTVMNRAEIVHVTAYNSATGVVTLDQPLSRQYTASPMFADINRTVSSNITVSGFGFNGLSGSTGSGGLLNMYLTDGVTVSDISVTNYTYSGVIVQSSRSVSISGVTVTNALSQGPGNGYGVLVSRDRFVTVSNVTASNNRHAVIVHGGSTDVLVQNSTSTGGTFDTHGMDERRIQFTNCQADTGFDAANQQWWAGDSNVTCTNCTFGAVNISPGASAIAINNSTLGTFSFSDATTKYTAYGKGYADGITITGCYISAPYNLVREAAWAGMVTFQTCTLEALQTSWSQVLLFNQMEMNLYLNNCTIISHSVRAGDSLVQINSLDPLTQITIRNTAFRASGPVNYAVAQSLTSLAKLTVANCYFVSTALTALLVGP